MEAMHAHGLVRRRTNLLTSAEEAARYAGCAVTKLPNWRLLVNTPHDGTHLVGVTPRLPQADASSYSIGTSLDYVLIAGCLYTEARALSPGPA